MEKGNERKSYPSDLTDEQWAEIEPLYSGMRNYMEQAGTDKRCAVFGGFRVQMETVTP